MITDWMRDPSGDPRFDLTEEELSLLNQLVTALMHPTGGDHGEVGAGRAYIDGEPVVVVVTFVPSLTGEGVDLRPLAVMVNHAVFEMLTPPPSLDEEQEI